MYSAPLRDGAMLPHQKEREEWARRLKAQQARQKDDLRTETAPSSAPAKETPAPVLSGDAALIGLILFLLSGRTKSDGILLCILVYLLMN